MKKKNLLIIGAALSLSACSMSDLGLSDESPNWRPYKDIDKSTQYVTFTSSTTAYFESHPKEIRQDEVGRAYKKGKLDSKELIGYLFNIYDANGISMATYFGTPTDKSLNPHQKDHIGKLAKAKKINFYEFGKGRLSHAEFSATKGMCEDFNGKNGVKIKMATNYYQDYDNYYTSLLSANISRKEIKDIDYQPLITGNKTFTEETKQHESKQGKDVAYANLKEKATIFVNIICR